MWFTILLNLQILRNFEETKKAVSEFNEFKPRLKSHKNRFQLNAGLNLEKLNTILSELFKFGLRSQFQKRFSLCFETIFKSSFNSYVYWETLYRGTHVRGGQGGGFQTSLSRHNNSDPNNGRFRSFSQLEKCQKGFFTFELLKGTVSVISSDPPCKDYNACKRYP